MLWWAGAEAVAPNAQQLIFKAGNHLSPGTADLCTDNNRGNAERSSREISYGYRCIFSIWELKAEQPLLGGHLEHQVYVHYPGAVPSQRHLKLLLRIHRKGPFPVQGYRAMPPLYWYSLISV